MTNVAYLWVTFSVFVMIIFTTGCVEERSTGIESATPSKPVVIVTTLPQPQVISGIDKITEVSGKEIIISGTNNQVKILNKDVSKIVVSGVNNIVLYPQEANPQIVDSGINTQIRTYS